MATLRDITTGESLGTRFVAALVRQDWMRLEGCFDHGACFRALIPPGFREAKDSAAVAQHFRRWFGDADQLMLLSADVEQIEDRLGISYRFRLHEDQWYIVEQRAYCQVIDGQIRHMDLLCSGFRPESGPTPDR
jgi:hypothetical protein